MRLGTHISARLRRGLSIRSLGPNEARLYYDAAVGAMALALSVAFGFLFLPDFHTNSGNLFLAGLPLLALFFNAVFGIYTRLKSATGTKKALVLLFSVICSCLCGALLGAQAAPVVLWGLAAVAPMSVARLLLNLPYSKHHKLAAIAVNQRGPVVVIGGAGYIGSHTVDLLLREGRRVRVLDRLMYGRESWPNSPATVTSS